MSKKHTGLATSMPAGIMIGTLICTVLTAVGCAIFSWTILYGWFEAEMIGYGSMIVLLIASIVGSAVSVHKIKRRYLAVCMLTGTAYFLILVTVTAFLFGGHYTGMWVTALLIAAGSIAVSLVASKGKNRARGGKSSRRKIYTG